MLIMSNRIYSDEIIKKAEATSAYSGPTLSIPRHVIRYDESHRRQISLDPLKEVYSYLIGRTSIGLEETQLENRIARIGVFCSQTSLF